jgi:hypothetical protein
VPHCIALHRNSGVVLNVSQASAKTSTVAWRTVDAILPLSSVTAHQALGIFGGMIAGNLHASICALKEIKTVYLFRNPVITRYNCQSSRKHRISIRNWDI